MVFLDLLDGEGSQSPLGNAGTSHPQFGYSAQLDLHVAAAYQGFLGLFGLAFYAAAHVLIALHLAAIARTRLFETVVLAVAPLPLPGALFWVTLTQRHTEPPHTTCTVLTIMPIGRLVIPQKIMSAYRYAIDLAVCLIAVFDPLGDLLPCRRFFLKRALQKKLVGQVV